LARDEPAFESYPTAPLTRSPGRPWWPDGVTLGELVEFPVPTDEDLEEVRAFVERGRKLFP